MTDIRTTIAVENARSASLQNSLSQADSIAAQSRARIAEEAARNAEHRARMNSSSDGDKQAIYSLQRQLEKAHNDLVQAQLARQDEAANVKEWMHSNEALKFLARHYSKQLGVSDEQRQKDFRLMILKTAEEDPRFTSTDLGKRVAEKLKESE